MLSEGVLVLTLGDAHVVLDVEVREEGLKPITCTLACAIGVEDAKALWAFALCQAVVDRLGVDAALVAALDGGVDADG